MIESDSGKGWQLNQTKQDNKTKPNRTEQDMNVTFTSSYYFLDKKKIAVAVQIYSGWPQVHFLDFFQE